MKKNISILSIIAMLLYLFGPVSEAKESSYIVGREDVLEISVWGSTDLTKTVVVDDDGTINYGFLGPIEASGHKIEELKFVITAKLAAGYVKDPKVDVVVKEYNSKKILVFGEVEKPGLYRLKAETPLLELLFLVGGVKPKAKKMTVIRPNNQNAEVVPVGMQGSDGRAEKSEEDHSVRDVDLMALLSKGDLSQNVTIMPGDTIYVSSGTGEKFYVLGQVKNPGPIEWAGKITVLEAIKRAEGPTETAALNRIVVRKIQNGHTQELKVNVVDSMRGKKKDDILIEPETIVIVPRSWV